MLRSREAGELAVHLGRGQLVDRRAVENEWTPSM
jgi:hypothetical protein